MKNAKKRIALLLAVVMLFTLCACGKKKALNGEWTLTFVPSAMGFDQLLPFEGFTAQGTIITKAVIKDGVMEIYPDGFADWATQVSDDLYEWIWQDDNIYAFLSSDYDMSAEDFKAECDREGTTKQELLNVMRAQLTKEALTDAVLEGLGESETITHSFERKGDELHFDEGVVWTVEISEDKIVVTHITSDQSSMTLKNNEMVFSK